MINFYFNTEVTQYRGHTIDRSYNTEVIQYRGHTIERSYNTEVIQYRSYNNMSCISE